MGMNTILSIHEMMKQQLLNANSHIYALFEFSFSSYLDSLMYFRY